MAGRERLVDYKRRGLKGVGRNRRELADERRALREQRRTRDIGERRGLYVEDDDVATSNKKQVSEGSNRLAKLQTWREQKEKAKKLKENGYKPAFIVGTIKYDDNHLYRPPQSSTFKAPSGLKPLNPFTSQRVLRSRTKPVGSSKTVKKALNEFASAMQSRADAKMLTHLHEAGPSSSCIPDEGCIPNRSYNVIPNGESILNRSYTIIPEVVVTDKEEKIIPEMSDNSDDPQVVNCGSEELVHQVLDIGKKTDRRSRRAKKSIKILDGCPEQNGEGSVPVDGASEQTSVPLVSLDTDCNKPGDYFRSLHKEVIGKLTSLCTEWNVTKVEDVPEDIKDSIDVAVGYAKLLMSQKLLQFEKLICEHENTTDGTELKVLSSDLDAFWNLVYIEVSNIYGKFEDLKSLKENNWVAEKIPVKKRNKNVPPPSRKPKLQATSTMRSFIAQARKKALLGNKENNLHKSICDGILEGQQIGMVKPMSPVVMRIAALAKGVASPQSKAPPQEGSVLQNKNQVAESPKTPFPTPKTPGRRNKINMTPVDSPLRRSARLSSMTQVFNF